MLARRGSIRLPSGVVIETPLLLPSFSSKGFGDRGDGVPVIAPAIEFAMPLITDATLISAYDVHYKLLPDIENLRETPPQGIYGTPAAYFIDSGGYERSPYYDLAEPYHMAYEPLEWDEEKLEEVAQSLPNTLSAVLVNFDYPGLTFEEQIRRAAAFFDRYPHFASDFLIKPDSDRAQYINVPRLGGVVEELRRFDIIGVTEKELGNSILDRMTAIARLRTILDAAGLRTPIHVFGSLDPLLSPCYFLAGAEIFDGLSWLRYAYHNGLAVYADALAALRGEWTHHQAQRRATMLAANLTLRDNLMIRMKRFVMNDADFGQFAHHADQLRDAYEATRTRVERPDG